MRKLLIAAALVAAATVVARGEHHHDHTMPLGKSADNPAIQAFRETEARMHEDIIKAQDTEIAQMQAFLKRRESYSTR